MKTETEFIPVHPQVDQIFSEEGGLPRRCMIEIAGPDGCGKTTFAIFAAIAAQKLNLKVGWLDVEMGLNKKHAKFFGLNLDKVDFGGYPTTAEGTFTQIIRMCREGYGLVILDSVAGLNPQSSIELEDEQLEDEDSFGGGGGQYAKVASFLSRVLSRTQRECIAGNTCIIFINQLRANIQKGPFAGRGPKDQTFGGWTLKHFVSIRAEIRRVGWLKYAGKVVGARMKVRCPTKNRYASPQQEALWDVIFDHKAPSVEEMNKRKKNKIGGLEAMDVKED